MAKEISPRYRDARECSQEEIAKHVLGDCFISAQQISKFLGRSYGTRVWAHLLLTFPSPNHLELIQKCHGFLVPTPPQNMTLEEMLGIFKNCIGEKDKRALVTPSILASYVPETGWIGFISKNPNVTSRKPKPVELIWFQGLFRVFRGITNLPSKIEVYQ